MILKVYEYPSAILRKISKPVKTIDKKIKKLCKDMVDTKNSMNAVGISAPQVGHNLRIIVCQELPSSNDIVMINPVIVEHSSEKIVATEGCLSFPNEYWDNIPRYESVTVEYLSVNNVMHRKTITGFNARIVQHEMDHINGILSIDYQRSQGL